MGTGKLLGNPNKLRGSDLRWTTIPSRESRILLAASCYGNRDKLWRHEPVLASRLHFFFIENTHSRVYLVVYKTKLQVFFKCSGYETPRYLFCGHLTGGIVTS